MRAEPSATASPDTQRAQRRPARPILARQRPRSERSEWEKGGLRVGKRSQEIYIHITALPKVTTETMVGDRNHGMGSAVAVAAPEYF